MKTALVFRHIPYEGLAALTPAFETKGYNIKYIDLCADVSKEDVDAADVMIVMGGSMGAYEENLFPFLKKELSLIEHRLAIEKPIMGICLGSQLLARCLGARIYRAPKSEIGFAPITLTDAGQKSCLAPYIEPHDALHWHSDAFDLPLGATRLAYTSDCETQAFQIGSSVIGFQFHPEVSGQNIEPWLLGNADELAADNIDPIELRRIAHLRSDQRAQNAFHLASNWLASINTQAT